MKKKTSSLYIKSNVLNRETVKMKKLFMSSILLIFLYTQLTKGEEYIRLKVKDSSDSNKYLESLRIRSSDKQIQKQKHIRQW